MENLRIALRVLWRGSGNVIKIVCLGVGLLMGLLLVAKVVFELSYDNFYPDAGRVFAVQSNIEEGEDGTWTFFETSGGIAPGIAAEVAGVEAATRIENRSVATVELEPDGKWEGGHIRGDRYLFAVLPRPVVEGAGSEALAVQSNILVSRTLALRMGGDAVGKTVMMDGGKFVIAGVYEDIPDNSHLPKADIVSSLENDRGAAGWRGGDRYLGYVKLAPGVDYRSLTPAIRRMQESHQDVQADRKRGVDLHYSLLPLREIHAGQPAVRRNVLILGILAIVVLVAAVMNYMLVDVASVPGRAKGVATRRCYGAQRGNIVGMVFVESLLHVALSLGFAAVLTAGLSDFIERSLEVSLPSLLGLPVTIAVLAAISLAILAVAVIIPARMLMNIPVATVFRSYKRSGRVWKLTLLGVQFAVSAFIVVFLMSVHGQYSMMIDYDPGYNPRGVVTVNVRGLNNGSKNLLVEELRAMPQVEDAAAAFARMPYGWAIGGNSVSLPGQEEQINIYDFGAASRNYLSVMEISMIAGEGFTDVTPDGSSVISRSLAERIENLMGWESVIGRTMTLPIHDEATIVGIYDDIRIGSMMETEDRPSAIFMIADMANPRSWYGPQEVVVRLREMSRESIDSVQATIARVLPGAEIYAEVLEEKLRGQYDSVRMFRGSVLAACLIILAITMAGLIGFVSGETNRRAAEIAIRKVHGATSRAILWLLGLDVARIALAALVPGAVGALFAADKWMQSFAGRAPLSPVTLATGCLALLAVIVAVTLFNSLRIARRNPVESLKNE